MLVRRRPRLGPSLGWLMLCFGKPRGRTRARSLRRLDRLFIFCLAACGPSTPTEPGASAAPNASAAPAAESPDDVVQVAVGSRHSCLRTRTGKVECWGWNDYGQLGDGSLVPHFRPAPVRNLTDAVDLAAFVDGTCAARRDGSVWCWGRHGSWNPPRPWENERKAPAKIDGLADALEVHLSLRSVVVMTRSRNVRAHPSNSMFGPGHDVAVGPLATCWLTPERAVFCRGEVADSGFLVDGVEVAAMRSEQADEIVMLGDGACVLTAAKQPTCFTRRATDGAIDVERPLVSNVSAFASTYTHACAATGDGRLTCFRAGMDRAVTLVEGAGEVKSLALDEHVGCLTRVDGTAHCWGNGEWGQLGDGSTAKLHSPTVVPGIPPIVEIAASNSEHFALAEDGRLFQWGRPWCSRQARPARSAPIAPSPAGATTRTAGSGCRARGKSIGRFPSSATRISDERESRTLLDSNRADGGDHFFALAAAGPRADAITVLYLHRSDRRSGDAGVKTSDASSTRVERDASVDVIDPKRQSVEAENDTLSAAKRTLVPARLRPFDDGDLPEPVGDEKHRR